MGKLGKVMRRVSLFCAATAIAATGQTFATLFSFDEVDGAAPNDALVQGTDGNFYGTTYQGGDLSCDAPNGCGTVFKITPAGILTTLHRFESSDGANPYAALVLGTDGKFYGTTLRGGVGGFGTVFKITAQGMLKNPAQL